MSPVFEVFLGALAACGVFFRGLIHSLELWAVLTEHSARIAALRAGPSSAGFELPWQVFLGLLRPVFVVVRQWEWLPLGAGYHARVDPASEASMQGRTLHPSKKQMPGRGITS